MPADEVGPTVGILEKIRPRDLYEDVAVMGDKQFYKGVHFHNG